VVDGVAEKLWQHVGLVVVALLIGPEFAVVFQ
jgi:hypothetical protein